MRTKKAHAHPANKSHPQGPAPQPGHTPARAPHKEEHHPHGKSHGTNPSHEQGPKHDTRAHGPHKGGTRRPVFIGGGALLAILFLTVFLAWHHHSQIGDEGRLKSQTEAAGNRVDTTTVTEAPPVRLVTLIGETRAFYSVTLFARVSGYLDRLQVDIGDRVSQGQLLAHVESPEQEQAYNSARADSYNKRRIANRAVILKKRQLISQQQAEQAVADADVSEANLRTQTVMRGYQDIVAPFDGVISNRFVDLGWLLQNASGSQAASQPLFMLSKVDPIRVFLYVDQKDAPYVKAGDPVEISVGGGNDAPVNTKITMIAGELDPKTRTLLTEVIIPNPNQRIVPGSFVQATMKLSLPKLMKLPVQALVMRDKRPFVSVIQDGGKLHYATIDLAQNDGEDILIRSGVQQGEKVAINVGNKFAEGQQVRVASQAAGQVGQDEPKSSSGDQK